MNDASVLKLFFVYLDFFWAEILRQIHP